MELIFIIIVRSGQLKNTWGSGDPTDQNISTELYFAGFNTFYEPGMLYK